MEYKAQNHKGTPILVKFQKRDKTDHATVDYAQLLFQN